MKLKYVGCFESVVLPENQTVKQGEIIEITDEFGKGLMANPGQWEIVEDAEKASRKGVK